jgi:hypothetical protein
VALWCSDATCNGTLNRTRTTRWLLVEGQNVTIEYRWAEAQYDRMPAIDCAGIINRQGVNPLMPRMRIPSHHVRQQFPVYKER